MKSSLLLLLLSLALAIRAQNFTTEALSTTRNANPDYYADSQCGKDLSNLWLDVVVVVDNSKGMTKKGLSDVAANIGALFAQGTRIGVDPDEPRTTRVGLVTYSSDAQIVADLNKFKSYEELSTDVFSVLGSVSSNENSYLATGLRAAEQLLDQANRDPSRQHYKRVVIVYASTYKGTGKLSPLPVAERLRGAGVTIITAAFSQGNEDYLLKELAKIATPHNSFTNADTSVKLDEVIQGALVQANCYCPDDWTQYRQSFSDVFSRPYGVCLRAVGLTTTWNIARIACRRSDAHLVSELNAHKHDFVLRIASNTTGFSYPLSYHIGLNFVNGEWSWDQGAGNAPRPVQDDVFQDWNPGYPKSYYSKTAVLNQQAGGSNQMESVGWQNVNQNHVTANYVCEAVSCDTDHYCGNDDDEATLRASLNSFLLPSRKH